MENSCAVVLAAGDGKRMKSSHPKVLSRVLFDPMLKWVLDSVKNAGVESACVVTGAKHEAVEAFLTSYDPAVETVYQEQRLGTAHAVLQAAAFIEQFAGGSVLVLCGDAPFLDAETIHNALEFHKKEENAATVISAEADDPTGYGRIVRGSQGCLQAIVEERDADEEIRALQEVNSGAYWFQADALLSVLGRVENNNTQKEYYLTDTIRLLAEDGKRVNAFVSRRPETVLGANNCLQLHELNEHARRMVLERLMLDGVEIPCLDGIMIGPDVAIGRGTTILPGTILRGDVRIGEDCVIGPNSLVENSVIGSNVTLNAVQCCQSEIEDYVTAGPFVHIRPGSRLNSGVKVGDFVEIKNSTVGEGSKVPHLTYVGDSDVGAHVNFGCGCVTVNYDGKVKNRCKVGNYAFIGCNTNLVAPVEVGDGAYTAAGSTITENVPADALAIARARQINKEEWAKKRRKQKI